MGGTCISGAASCTDTRLSSMAARRGIAEVLDCSGSPALVEGSGDGSPIAGSAPGHPQSSGAESRFLRSMSPIKKEPLGPGSCSEGNHVAQQQQRQLLQQQNQQQRAANLDASAVLPSCGQGRGRSTSFHHHSEGTSSTAACGSPMLRESTGALDLQGASIADPWSLSNSAASPVESFRPILPLQQQQPHTTARQASTTTSVLGGSRQQIHGHCTPAIMRSLSPMDSTYSCVDSMLQQGVPQHFASPRAMSMSISPRQHCQQLVP